MNVQFNNYANLYQMRGYLSADELRRLYASATSAEVDAPTSDAIRVFGASESLAARLIGERSAAWRNLVARLEAFADGEGLVPAAAVALVAQMRDALGEPPAAVCKRLGCGQTWIDAARAVERLAGAKRAS